MSVDPPVIYEAGGLCPDCGVEPGDQHRERCDVARCALCGVQRISCTHARSPEGAGQIWTGRWPGDEEVEEGLAPSLNTLLMLGYMGWLTWDGQRWQRPSGPPPGTSAPLG